MVSKEIMELTDYGTHNAHTRHNNHNGGVINADGSSGAHEKNNGNISFTQPGNDNSATALAGSVVAATTIPRKEQEFIDHTLLAPTYIRDSNNLIMDNLIMDPSVVFSKNVVHLPAATTASSANGLTSDLHFQNSIFSFVSKQNQLHDVSESTAVAVSSLEAAPRADNAGSVNTQIGIQAVPDDGTEFIASLNSDFLSAAHNKTFCDSVVQSSNHHHHQHHHHTTASEVVVQQFPPFSLLNESTDELDDTAVLDDDDILYANSSARKLLPHKKRISRKLKVPHSGFGTGAGVGVDVSVADAIDNALPALLDHTQHKLPEQRLSGVVTQMHFNCEICGHSTASQIEFFAHLKQHYEPTTPETILAAMKTSLEALAPEKECDNICAMEKKVAADQVFNDVHLNFVDFPHVEETVRVAMHENPNDDMKILNSNSIDKCINYVTQVNITPLKDIAADEVEFSDTEDMLEGIRNVVDKVSIEDTCDEIDLMGPNGIRAPWLTNDNFPGMSFKSKPFGDVSFSGALAQIDVSAAANPSDLNLDTTKESVISPLKIIDEHKLMPTYVNDATDDASSLSALKQCNETFFNTTSTPTPPAASTPSTTVDTNAAMLHEIDNNYVPIMSSENNEIQPQATVYESKPVAASVKKHRKSRRAKKKDQLEQKVVGIYTLNKEDFELAAAEETETTLGEWDQEEIDDDFEDQQFIEDEYDAEQFASQISPNKRQYICTHCKREFNSGNALKYHNRTHTGVRPHQCDICGKSFFAQGALKAHQRTHTGDKPFECEVCQRKFRQWGDLKYHTVSIHSEEKSHQCEFCGKAFSRKYSLVLHRRIHTSERNYKCEHCGKTFRASTYLQNHRKIHTGEKPYECNICNKRFRVSGDLRRHSRIHQRRTVKEEETEKTIEVITIK